MQVGQRYIGLTRTHLRDWTALAPCGAKHRPVGLSMPAAVTDVSRAPVFVSYTFSASGCDTYNLLTGA